MLVTEQTSHRLDTVPSMFVSSQTSIANSSLFQRRGVGSVGGMVGTSPVKPTIESVKDDSPKSGSYGTSALSYRLAKLHS